MGTRLTAAKIETPAGGGAFTLPHVVLGVFLVDQPAHRISLGGDRRKTAPLKAHRFAAGSALYRSIMSLALAAQLAGTVAAKTLRPRGRTLPACAGRRPPFSTPKPPLSPTACAPSCRAMRVKRR